MKKQESVNIEFNSDGITAGVLIRLFEIMLRIRKVQLRIEREYPKDEIKTPVHLCTGQEAVPAGVCANLEKGDYVFSNYRGHGHYLAKGGDLKRLVAELYGRQAGCSRGRGGSMHLIDASVGLMGSSSIVAGGIPLATGAALALRFQEKKAVAAAFFGDGAVDEGVLYESVNFAVLKKLPVMYVCENNFYAVCSPQSNRQSLDNIHQRFQGCGLGGYRVDGNNVIDVYRTAAKVIEDIRNGGGPSLIECRTYRWRGHSGGDPDVSLGYRTQHELDQWLRRCPVENFKQFLINKNFITAQDCLRVDKAFDKEIDDAFKFAMDSPSPKEEELLKHLYAQDDD